MTGQPNPSNGDRCNLLHGAVMVVEDNMLIAMVAEDLLKAFGASECHVVASVAAANDLIVQTPLVFALLDINLGNETSDSVAELLRRRAIPFVVASGYDVAGDVASALDSAPRVTKPYTEAQLCAAIAAACGVVVGPS